MREPLLLLTLLAACAEPPAARERAPEPDVTVEQPTLPAWPAPRATISVERARGTHALEVQLDEAHADARVDVRSALGPVAPGCDDGEVEAVIAEGASRRADGLDSNASLSICVRDEDGRVRSRVDRPGARTVPDASFVREGERVLAEVTVAPLDHDATALAFVAFPRAPEDPDFASYVARLHCEIEPGYPPDEDAPERCTYDCSGGRVAGEIPREVLDRVLASPAQREAEDEGDYLYPSRFGVRVPVDVREDEVVTACVRTRDGGLETGRSHAEDPESGPWFGCPIDTPSGACTYGADELRAGDAVLGLDGRTPIVAIVRSARRRTSPIVTVLASGYELSLAESERVVAADGSEVAGGDLRRGMTLLRRGQPARVSEVIEQYRAPWSFVDLAGATHLSRNGFAIRDAGDPSEVPGGAPLASVPLEVAPGRGDCSVEARWTAASFEGAVSLAARRATGPLFARGEADCGSPILTVDAASLEAVASLGPEAQIVTQLYGEPIECDGDYHVSVCGAGATVPALWARAAPWCLPAGTMIETVAGPRPIEKLSRGDRVRAWGGAGAEARVLDLLTRSDRELIALRLEDGTLLEATPEHVVLVGERLRPRRVRELSAGDRLHVRTPEGLASRAILTIEPAGRADVYELRVSAPDTYFANGVLVHNY